MPKIIYGSQNDEAWRQRRIGSIGGSDIKNLMAKGQGKTRETLLYQLAAERLTGIKHEGYSNSIMERGLEREQEALDDFSFVKDMKLERVALIKGDLPGTHCSPDALLMNGQAGVEVKCPLSSTHIRYVLENKVPSEYIPQIQYSLWISGLFNWYFVSYAPELSKLHIFIIKVARDEEYINKIVKKVTLFLKELDELVDNYKNL